MVIRTRVCPGMCIAAGSSALTTATGLASSTASAKQILSEERRTGHSHIPTMEAPTVEAPTVQVPEVTTPTSDSDEDKMSLVKMPPIKTPTPTAIPTMTAIPTATATAIPTATATPCPTKVSQPDLFISKTHLNGNRVFRVGQRVTFLVVVGDTPTAGPVPVGSTITVTDVLPEGLRNIQVNAQGWHINTSNNRSPSVITATFNGGVQPGQLLPVIRISGELTNQAVPSFTNTATVDVKDDACPENNTATDTICVERQQHHQQHHQQQQQQQQQHEHEHVHEHIVTGVAGVSLPITGSDPMGHALF